MKKKESFKYRASVLECGVFTPPFRSPIHPETHSIITPKSSRPFPLPTGERAGVRGRRPTFSAARDLIHRLITRASVLECGRYCAALDFLHSTIGNPQSKSHSALRNPQPAIEDTPQ